MELQKQPKSRVRGWLEDNRLVPDRTRMHGPAMIPELLRVFNHWAHKILLYISQVALAVMVVLVIMTVTLRYVFSTGIGWAESPRAAGDVRLPGLRHRGARPHAHLGEYRLQPLSEQRQDQEAMDIFSDVCVLLCGLFLMFSAPPMSRA